MTAYIIKSILCSAIFLILYRLLLEHERMHVFKRYYLLATIVLSLTIPLLTFNLHTESEYLPQFIMVQATQTEVEVGLAPLDQPVRQHVDYTGLILTGIYLSGVIVFLVRFVSGLSRFKSKIKHSAISEHAGAILVHSDEKTTPYSFFKYIFINKNDNIEEILAHELAHVKQKHSLDKVFIEFIQVLWWFNPILPLYKKAIYTNHEFLADECVNDQYGNIERYQTLLMNNCVCTDNAGIANQFNFQITKKRLIMMTKTRLPKIALAKKLAMLPIMLCMIALFSTLNASTANPAPSDNAKAPYTNEGISNELMAEYLKITSKYVKGIDNGQDYMVDMRIDESDRETLEKIFAQMSKEQQKKQIICFQYKAVKQTPTSSDLLSWQDPAKYDIKIDGNAVDNSVLTQYGNTDFGSYGVTPNRSIVSTDANGNVIPRDTLKTTVNLFTVKYYNEIANDLSLVAIGDKDFKFNSDGTLIIPE